VKKYVFTHEEIGVTQQDMQTAGRVAMAIHDHVMTHPEIKSKRYTYARVSIGDTLLRAGGYRSHRERAADFQSWLAEVGKTDVDKAHAKRVELGFSANRQYTNEVLVDLEDRGLIRYVRRWTGNPGLIVWKGPK
jgi:hypothetical protein